MLTDERCEELMQSKEKTGKPFRTEGWARIGNTIVIYDHEDPPEWLLPVLAERGED